MVKAVFFDLDGTLVSYKTHEMPQSTRDALDILSSKGIKIFISTGRHLKTIDNIGDWRPDGYVLLNGGMCVVDDEVIFERHIAEEDIQGLLHYMRTVRDFPCVLLLKDELVMNHMNEDAKRVFKHLNFELPTLGSLEERAKETVYELLIVKSEEREKELMKHMPNSETTRSHMLFGDVIPKGSNKWAGVEYMMQHFGLKHDEVITFGDGNNDITMVQHAHIGVAMGNGTEQLKAIANMVTDTVDEDGIWNAMKKLELI